MRKTLRILRKIDYRKGNSSMILGLLVMLLAFTGIVVVIEIFDLNYTQAKVQTITDVIADGATVAGNTPAGFDEVEMLTVANELLEKNEMTGAEVEMEILATPSYDLNGNLTGEILTYTNLEVTKDYYIPSYISFEQRFTISSTAVVSVVPSTNAEGWLSISYADNPWQITPFVTTTPENRNGPYVTWFINNYLNPEFNAIYASDGEITHEREFIYDYLVCMGLEHNDYPTNSIDGIVSVITSNGEWTTISEREEVTIAANKGQPVMAIQRSEEGAVEKVYVVMPSHGLHNNDIAVAYVSTENSNYDTLDFEELNCEFYTHV